METKLVDYFSQTSNLEKYKVLPPASQLYKAILDKLEVNNRIIHGSSDYSWNEVEIDGEYYPIDVIEADLVKFQQESVKMIKETTEELLNSIDEEKEIKKNKKNATKN